MDKETAINFDEEKLQAYWEKEVAKEPNQEIKMPEIYNPIYVKWLERQVVSMINCGLLVLVIKKERVNGD